MTLKVHFNRMHFAEYTEYFKSLLDPDICITEGEQIPQSADYEILIHPSPTKDWLEASDHLVALVNPWAGISEGTLKIMREYPDISLHNLHHNNFNTAELGFALLLAAAKNLIPMDQALRRDDWSPRYEDPKAILLKGRTALVLGFGEIGQALGAYCLGIGMNILAIKKHPEMYDGNEKIEVYPDEQLHNLLPRAEVLLIALPLTRETKNLIDKNEINLMPKGSILINVGRGPIVNQYALYDALVEGQLRAAGSDVWYNYPKSKEDRVNTPPADLPFGKLENFVLSPHRGGMVEEVEQQRAEALAKLLNSANRGEEIPNKVDLSSGY